MEFRALGPLQVREDGRLVDVRAGKQRTLLAALLLSAGEVVSADRLIDAIWEGDPPESALNSIHIYVSQLRKVLGNERLLTSGRGYVLQLDGDEFDVARFERLAAEGRQLLADGRSEEAGKTLREALALWRGPVLGDLGRESFALATAARLDEHRLLVLEKRIDADLALGRHADLVPELEALVREQPLRERFRAQLMLALYRSKRQADALGVYRQARRTLVDEIGLEPGHELQDLERAILRQDRELDMPSQDGSAILRGRRKGGLLIAVGGSVLLAAALAVVAIAIARGRGDAGIVVAQNSVAVIDPKTDRIVADIPVGDGPTRVAAADGRVWILNEAASTISLVDAETRSLDKTFAIGVVPADIALGLGRAWVADSATASVLELSPDSAAVVRRLDVSAAPPHGDGGIAFGLDTLWLLNDATSLSRIDPDTGDVVAKFSLPGLTFDNVAVGQGSAWVGGCCLGMMRVNPQTGSVARVAAAADGPIAFGFGSVWAADTHGNSVWQLDPRSGDPVGTVRCRGHALDVAVGEGSVWVACADGKVLRIAGASGEVIRTIEVGGTPSGIAVGEGVVWVGVG